MTKREMKFAEAFTLYIDHKKRAGHRELTLLNNEYMYRKHVAPFWDNYDLDDIDRGLTSEYFTELQPQIGIANTRAVKKFLSAFCNFCVDEDYLAKNYCHRLPLAPYHADEQQILTQDQTKYLIRKTRNHRFYPHLVLLITTGVRHGEMAGLQWQDVDFTRRTIRIARAFSHGKVRELKTAESHRTIGISERLVSALRRQKKLVYKQHGRNCEWVFPASLGRPMSGSNFNAAMSRLLADLGLPHVTVHSFRHYHTTYLFSKKNESGRDQGAPWMVKCDDVTKKVCSCNRRATSRYYNSGR